MKKIIIIISLLFLLTGCNSYVELNDLGIINAIGIEKNNNNYKVYASIIENVEKNGTPNFTIYQIEGNNLLEIFDHLNLKLNKKIYLSHLDLLLLNPTIKTKELEEIINFFLNNNESRNDFLVVTTDNINNILKNSSFQEINNLIKINEQETSKSIYTTMYDVMNNYFEKKPLYFTNLTLEDKIIINGITKLNNNKQTLIPEDKIIYINYLLNNVNTYKVNINCSENKYLYLNILTSNTNILNNKILITNEIKVITNDCNLTKKDINSIFNNYLKTNLKEFTNKSITIQNTIRSTYENN